MYNVLIACAACVSACVSAGAGVNLKIELELFRVFALFLSPEHHPNIQTAYFDFGLL